MGLVLTGSGASLGLVALSLSGYTRETRESWREVWHSLHLSLGDPYLQAMFAFLTAADDSYTELLLKVFVSVGEALKGYLGWNQHAASAQIVEGNVRGWQFVIVSLRGGFVRFEGADEA
ncbi:hypothetical protein HPB52_022270 [Rhipicephalus sanguineus]|uniref:MIOS-like alpha-solenoid domain-containing protein n=1 Tax=Rhipicephalus sanguineus TaxID=34632 RepID=A0A9D4Q3F1_RHISA|nr:hypothetical protein HPB52_022270 [Rhipicephalus sanguineus]